ncbi:MAG: pyruvate kinase [Candidatus Niyogibacteria bacterium]|nr:pyruvate kinase [Candidatus Niyogibacteria bacterium]
MKTKIIATLGPSSDSPEMIEKMIAAGMDIVRFNFSHCKHEEYIARKALVLTAAKKLKKKVKILQDLQGPRIRVGEMPKAGRLLVEKEEVIFTTERGGGKNEIFIDDPYLHLDIKAGEPIYLANGEMELLAKKIEGSKIFAEVVRGGTLYSRKGVNLPRTKLTTSGMTDKDAEDVRFAIKEGVDYVALSFVSSAEDVEKLRALVGRKVKIIAKIESAIAMEHLDGIIKVSDAIMIARGDLGIEIPIEELPFVQKNLVRQAAWHSKGSIMATQMLFSMTNHPHPTRAEVSDIANAVWDGADAVMLSDETASGAYPLEALEIMVKVVRKAEQFHSERPNFL